MCFKRFFLFIGLLVGLMPAASTCFAQDVTLQIPISSVNNVASAIIQSRYLSYGKFDDEHLVDYYSVLPTALSLSVQPGNVFTLTLTANITANFDVAIFDFDIALSNQRITITGPISLQANGSGYQITFTPQSFDYNGNGTIKSVLQVASSGLIGNIPPITVGVNSPLLAGIVGTYFTSATPVLSTTSNEIDLSLYLKAGSPVISAYNDMNCSVSVGNIQDLEGSNWVTYSSPAVFTSWTAGQTHYVQTPTAVLSSSNGANKYKNWFNASDLVHPLNETAPMQIGVTVGTNDQSYLAKFDPANHIQLSNSLEGGLSGGTITYNGSTVPSPYSDYDFYDPTNSRPVSTSVPNGTLGYNWSFLGWSDGVTSASRTVTVNGDINLTANWKGIHISNNPSAFSDNGQRKFIRIPDQQGHMFQVYTSMGHVWLESSTDGGQTWKLEFNGHPLDNTNYGTNPGPGSKCPSIDYNYRSNGAENYIAVVFQEPSGNGYTIGCRNFFYDPITGGYDYTGDPRVIYTETADPYSTNANPNISLGDYDMPAGSEVAIVTFERKSSSGGNPGINYLAFFTDNEGSPSSLPVSGWITGTDSNSVNASVYTNKLQSSLGYTALAWQENAGSYSRTIEYCFVYISSESGNSFTIGQTGAEDISSMLGNGYDSDPSIVEMPDLSARIVWITSQGPGGDPMYINAAYWDSGEYFMYDFNVQSVSINVNDDGISCFAWSSPGIVGNQWCNRASTGTTWNETDLNTTGSQVQLCNADTKNDMRVSSFYPFASPYYFNTSSGLGGVAKASPVQTYYGRGLALAKGNLKFHYYLKNLVVDGKSVSFIDAPNKSSYKSLDSINCILETESFQVNDNSKFLFSEEYGFLDSAKAESTLGDTGFVRCKAVLVDNSTGRTIGTIRNVDLNFKNTRHFTSVPYLLNTNGIGTRTVRLKFTVATNIDSPQVALVNSYQYENQVDSTSVQSVSLQQLDLIKDYALNQNYPNPFNPTTVISYTIPKNSHVTLKIYDVLGQEVETLVNENQQVGRYSVNFNGSPLASGVYFYRLVAGNHVITKKMLLLK